ARAERLEALAQLRDVVPAQSEPVERRAIPLDASQKDAAERAEAAAEADQRVASSGPGQHAEQARTRLAAKCVDLSGAGRIVSQESESRPTHAERHARALRDPSRADACDLKAAAAQIDDRAPLQRPAPQDGRSAQPRLFAAGQHPDGDALVAPQRA